MSRCTGLTAVWCPLHGDCTCPVEADGDRLSMDDGSCPLHAPDGPHPSARRRHVVSRRLPTYKGWTP